jgi:hypothetical protein
MYNVTLPGTIEHNINIFMPKTSSEYVSVINLAVLRPSIVDDRRPKNGGQFEPVKKKKT